MFSIFKKKKIYQIPQGYFPILTDIHSHILPGIDDGSPDIQTSLELIEGLMQLGIKQSIATPHIIGDMYRNNSETIGNALQLLKNALVEKQIDYKVHAAAEYMMDDYFLALLENKIPLLTLKDNIVLTEFSYAEKPYNAKQMAFTLITEGYQPILAHPERYGYYHNDLKAYAELKDLGFLLQVNLLSLTGYYGKPVAKAANYIIKNNLVSFTATDLHHERHMLALSNPSNKAIFAEVFKGKILNEEMAF
jgi:protein-tyrosine phosphatase